jgi:hypothetical protein
MRDSQSRGVTGAVVFDVSQGQAPLPSPGSALPLWRTNDEHRYNPPMGVSRCRVSFTDSEGISHAVEVQAESLYEAVALAVSEFRNDSVTSMPGPMTEFMISIQRPATEHRIRLGQVSQWATQGGTKEGPAGVTRRQKVLRLLKNT